MLFENLVKCFHVAKARFARRRFDAQLGRIQKTANLLHTFPLNKVRQRFPGVFFKQLAQIRRA